MRHREPFPKEREFLRLIPVGQPSASRRMLEAFTLLLSGFPRFSSDHLSRLGANDSKEQTARVRDSCFPQARQQSQQHGGRDQPEGSVSPTVLAAEVKSTNAQRVSVQASHLSSHKARKQWRDYQVRMMRTQRALIRTIRVRNTPGRQTSPAEPHRILLHLTLLLRKPKESSSRDMQIGRFTILGRVIIDYRDYSGNQSQPSTGSPMYMAWGLRRGPAPAGGCYNDQKPILTNATHLTWAKLTILLQAQRHLSAQKMSKYEGDMGV